MSHSGGRTEVDSSIQQDDAKDFHVLDDKLIDSHPLLDYVRQLMDRKIDIVMEDVDLYKEDERDKCFTCNYHTFDWFIVKKNSDEYNEKIKLAHLIADLNSKDNMMLMIPRSDGVMVKPPDLGYYNVRHLP